MGNNDKSVGEKVVEAAERKTGRLLSNATDQELDDLRVVEDSEGVKKVLVSLEWLENLEERLTLAERPVLVKVKDAVLSHKRQLILGATTVAALGAAAYAVTHKDQILETVEHTTEAAAEGVELTAQDVKKTARKARTGSTTK